MNEREELLNKAARRHSAEEIDGILTGCREKLALLRGEMDGEDESVLLGYSIQCEREQELEEIIGFWEEVRERKEVGK